MADKDKEIKIKAARQELEKKYKEELLWRGDENKARKVEFITSQILPIDIALGGGYPKGRILEIYGPESSGKTTLCLHLLAEIQRRGGIGTFIDMEHALDPVYAKNLGVNVDGDNFYLAQPMYAEQALDIAEAMVLAGSDVVIVDSVASLVPKAEVEGEMGDSHVGLQARLMSQAMRKLASVVSKSRAIVVFTNQIREKIGVMFGNSETTSGGRALRFYASIRVDIRRIEALKDSSTGTFYGGRHRVKVVKNKVAPPYREAEFDIIFGEGASPYSALLDLAADIGVVTKSGAWFSYGDVRLGQGRANASLFLRETKEVFDEIDAKVRALVFPESGE